MNVALKIKKELDDKADLKLIRKVISLYEKLKNEEKEFLSLDNAREHVDNLLGEVSISEKIKSFRSRENMTQKELALKSNIKQQHISEIERGFRPVGVATAKKLAAALNCHYRSLL